MRRPTLCSDRGDRLLSTICPDKQLCTVHMLQNLMHIINHFLEVQFSRRNTTQINLHYCIWHFDNMIIITINLCTEVHLSAQMLWITCQVWGKSWRILFAHVTYCWLEQSFILAFCCFKSHFAFSLRRGVSETKNIPRYGQSEIRFRWKNIDAFSNFLPSGLWRCSPFCRKQF